MSPSPDVPVRRPGGDLADYVSLLRRRWPAVLLLLAAGTGGGAALLWVVPPSYTASAQVLVTPTGLQEQTNQVTNRQREPLNLDTEAQIARSALVSGRVSQALRTTPDPVEVSVPPNTSVLELSYTASGPAAAAAGANAYAQAYLATRGEAATRALDVQLKALLSKLRQVNASLSTVVAGLPGLAKGTAERAMALQRQNVLGRQVYNLTVRYDALKTVAVTPGSVISPAVAPTEPGSPRPPLYLGSGLMIGLLAGAGLAWLGDRRARREMPGARRVNGLDLPGVREAVTRPGGPGRRGGEGTETRGGGESGNGVGSTESTESAVLLVSVPGASSRGVRRAMRKLERRGIPVLGALVGPPDAAPAAGETALPS